MKKVWSSMPASFPCQYELMYQKGTSDLALATHALAIDDDDIDIEIIFFHLQHLTVKSSFFIRTFLTKFFYDFLCIFECISVCIPCNRSTNCTSIMLTYY